MLVTGDKMEQLHFDNRPFFGSIRRTIEHDWTQQGMTAAQLAEKTGLGHHAPGQIESERDRHHVSLVSPNEISTALHASMDAFAAENGDK